MIDFLSNGNHELSTNLYNFSEQKFLILLSVFPNFTKLVLNQSPAWFKCEGSIVVDSIKENIKIGIAVNGNVRHISPVSHARSNIGAKTTIVVKTPKKTGVKTSKVPLIVDV